MSTPEQLVTADQAEQGLAAPAATGPGPTRRFAIWRQPAALFGIVIIVITAVLAIFAPLVAPYGLHQQVGPPFGAPSAHHWLGLDDGGMDVVTQLIYGARVSLLVGFAASAVSIIIGGTVGLLAGYFGGASESVLMRVTDFFLVIPILPLMIVVAALWGSNLTNIILIIGLLSWTISARVVHAQVKSVSKRMFILRARALGAGHMRILSRHVLPHIAPLLVANTALAIGNAIFFESALAFLGLSDPTKVSWGTMISNAAHRDAVSSGAWWAIVPPGLAIALVILAASFIGRAVEDAFNPRLAVAHLGLRRFRLRQSDPGEQ